MKISIVTASYNNAATIEQCIKSFLSQSYKQKELVIIDGGSTDGTLEILTKYKEEISYISEPDNGIYDALNKGIKLSTGTIIGTLGADDFYHDSQILEKIATTFKNTDSDSVYGDIKMVNPTDIEKVVRYWKGGQYNLNNWLYGWMPSHLTFFIKKENFEKYGYYNTTFVCAGDYELMLRMLYKNKVSSHYLPETILMMRTGGTSSASLKHRITANKEDRKAWKMNSLKPHWFTLWLKPISKISQLLFKS